MRLTHELALALTPGSLLRVRHGAHEATNHMVRARFHSYEPTSQTIICTPFGHGHPERISISRVHLWGAMNPELLAQAKASKEPPKPPTPPETPEPPKPPSQEPPVLKPTTVPLPTEPPSQPPSQPQNPTFTELYGALLPSDIPTITDLAELKRINDHCNSQISSADARIAQIQRETEHFRLLRTAVLSHLSSLFGSLSETLRESRTLPSKPPAPPSPRSSSSNPLNRRVLHALLDNYTLDDTVTVDRAATDIAPSLSQDPTDNVFRATISGVLSRSTDPSGAPYFERLRYGTYRRIN